MSRSNSQPVFVNKALSEHGHDHLYICIVYACSHSINGRNELKTRSHSPRSLSYLLTVPLQEIQRACSVTCRVQRYAML